LLALLALLALLSQATIGSSRLFGFECSLQSSWPPPLAVTGTRTTSRIRATPAQCAGGLHPSALVLACTTSDPAPPASIASGNRA
jgi:hypothetical protein